MPTRGASRGLIPALNLADLKSVGVARTNLGLVPDVTQFGAVGDGITDDTDALQLAIDTVSTQRNGSLYVPPVDVPGGEYYRITKRLIQKSNTFIFGAGYNSLIRNDRETSVTDGDMACFGWAGYSGSAASPLNVESETFYACNDVTAGSHSVTLTTAANAANFVIGDIIFLRNSTALDDQTVPGTGLPAHFQYMTMNEVVAVDTDTGVVTLLYPIDDSFSDVKMARSSGTLTDELGTPVQIRKNVGLSNLHLVCHWNQNKGCFVWGGAFRFTLENLWLEGADGLTMQLMGRGTVSNIEAVIGSKLWDAAYYTSHVHIDNVTRKQRPGDFFLAPHGPTLEIDSGTYNDETGEVVLTMVEAFNQTQNNRIEVGGSIKVSGLEGTGDLDKLQGVSVVTYADGDAKTIKYETVGDLGAMTITGGSLRDTAPDELCIIGQGSHDLKIRRLTIDAGDLDRDCLRVGRARRISLSEIEIIARGSMGVNRPVILGGTDYFGPDGVTIDGLIVRCGADDDVTPWSAVHLNGSDTAADPAQWNTLRGLQVYGSPSNAVKINDNAKKWWVIDPITPDMAIRNDSTDPTTAIVTGGYTLTTNPPVHEAANDTDGALTTKGADTVAKTYAVAASGASEHGGWVFRASGVATTDSGAATRFVKLLFDTTEICKLDLETSMSGDPWSIEARVLMGGAPNAQSFEATLRIGTDTETLSGTSTVSIGLARNFTLNYQLDAADTSVVLRTWEVEPFGHETR